MQYKYAEKGNYEDFACGRVIYQRAGFPNYPVRLSSEIFSRCMAHLEKEEGVVVYDPCCGSAYTLTVLGLLFHDRIASLYGSDINAQAIQLAEDNLSLLTVEGLANRERQIQDMLSKYNKESHREALTSIKRFSQKVVKASHIDTQCFLADALDGKTLRDCSFKADIIITDVPYGNLVGWSDTTDNHLDKLLESMIPIIDENSVIAISSDKKQKITSDKFMRLEKIKVGKRKVEILKWKGEC